MKTREKSELCAVCGGVLKGRSITYTQPWGQELYRFEQVPALVCTKCGEVWLDAKVVSQLIDELIEKQPKPKKYQKVPVFSFAELVKT